MKNVFDQSIKKSYRDYTERRAKKSPLFRDVLCSFFVGGFICLLGQGIKRVLQMMQVGENEIKTIVPIALIFLSCLLTGIGWYDSIARFGGAGTLVPITGFANAMCSPTIDNKAEGYVLGVGAKMFIIAGPVIVYGTLASVVYGVIYWITTLL
jgi:stage V sporulation protein AC